MAAAAASSGAGDGGAEEGGGERVKLLCCLGGRILPRPSDGALRCVGGDTRIVSVLRSAPLPVVLAKIADAYAPLPAPLAMRYQLPDEDLDALISVSTPEDLENMMEEYDKLAAAAPGPSPKLRVFLFPLLSDPPIPIPTPIPIPIPTAPSSATSTPSTASGGARAPRASRRRSPTPTAPRRPPRSTAPPAATPVRPLHPLPRLERHLAIDLRSASASAAALLLSPDISAMIGCGGGGGGYAHIANPSSSELHHSHIVSFQSVGIANVPGAPLPIPTNPQIPPAGTRVNPHSEENPSEAAAAVAAKVVAQPPAETKYRQPLSQLRLCPLPC
uniref:PB1 domain-containing protein n=1 Tax=Ananas comosus var. bracteatus TaxID=296719 RepID=A0A6V7PM48_ANACO|nr:unnamed protein product [Ananas comosus var. bracteatus]